MENRWHTATLEVEFSYYWKFDNKNKLFLACNPKSSRLMPSNLDYKELFDSLEEEGEEEGEEEEQIRK